MVNHSEKLPLFILTHEFFPKRGGIATFTEEMAIAAHKLGYKVEIWAPVVKLGDAKLEQNWPFKVRWIPLKGTHDLSCQFKMARHMIKERRRLRHSIVYLPEPGPVLAMSYLHFFKAFKPAQLLITFHGTEILRFASRPIARFLVSKLIKKADTITTPSRFSNKLLYQYFPFSQHKTRITPCALRTNIQNPPTKEKSLPDKIVILTVGRLHPRKGHTYVIEALKQLPHNLLNQIEYWIVGPERRGKYGKHLQQSANQVDFGIRFFGKISDEELSNCYRKADIFAMTSINHGKSVEGFGLVYLEASAFALPIIAHDVGGAPEAVLHEKTGLLVPPENSQALTKAFYRLITDKQLRNQLGTNGLAWAKHHSWQDSANILLSPPPSKD